MALVLGIVLDARRRALTESRSEWACEPLAVVALPVVDEGGIDVVIADIALYSNEPHGVALSRMIRRTHPHTRILFVTGVKNVEHLEPEIPREILYKPVELPDLSRKVQVLLSYLGRLSGRLLCF